MFTKFALKSILVLTVMILLSTLAVSSAVTAQEIVHDNSILASPPEQTIQGGSPVPGGPGFISVSTFGFKPLGSETILEYDGAMLYNGDTAPGLGVYVAPVNLPHGATISKVVFFYHDVLIDFDMTFYLQTVNMFDGSPLPVATTISTGTIGNSYVEAVPNPAAIVNNQLYSYILGVAIPDGRGMDLGLFSVRIDYSYPSYLPTVQK